MNTRVWSHSAECQKPTPSTHSASGRDQHRGQSHQTFTSSPETPGTQQTALHSWPALDVVPADHRGPGAEVRSNERAGVLIHVCATARSTSCKLRDHHIATVLLTLPLKYASGPISQSLLNSSLPVFSSLIYLEYLLK